MNPQLETLNLETRRQFFGPNRTRDRHRRPGEPAGRILRRPGGGPVAAQIPALPISPDGQLFPI